MDQSQRAALEQALHGVCAARNDSPELYIKWFLEDGYPKSVVSAVCKKLFLQGVHRIDCDEFARMWRAEAAKMLRIASKFRKQHFRRTAPHRYGSKSTQWPPYVLVEGEDYLRLAPTMHQAARIVRDDRLAVAFEQAHSSIGFLGEF